MFGNKFYRMISLSLSLSLSLLNTPNSGSRCRRFVGFSLVLLNRLQSLAVRLSSACVYQRQRNIPPEHGCLSCFAVSVWGRGAVLEHVQHRYTTVSCCISRLWGFTFVSQKQERELHHVHTSPYTPLMSLQIETLVLVYLKLY